MDPFGSQLLGREHNHQSHGAVAHKGDRLARADLGRNSGEPGTGCRWYP